MNTWNNEDREVIDNLETIEKLCQDIIGETPLRDIAKNWFEKIKPEEIKIVTREMRSNVRINTIIVTVKVTGLVFEGKGRDNNKAKAKERAINNLYIRNVIC